MGTGFGARSLQGRARGIDNATTKKKYKNRIKIYIIKI